MIVKAELENDGILCDSAPATIQPPHRPALLPRCTVRLLQHPHRQQYHPSRCRSPFGFVALPPGLTPLHTSFGGEFLARCRNVSEEKATC